MINIIETGYYIVEFADNFYFVTVTEGITEKTTLSQYDKWRQKFSIGICLDAGYSPQRIPHYVFDNVSKFERVDLNKYFTPEEQMPMWVVDYEFNTMLIELWSDKYTSVHRYVDVVYKFLQEKAKQL